jgi:hypothetical protein
MSAGRTAAQQALIDDELAALRFHWGDAYEIELDDEHGWRARRLSSQRGWLTGVNLDELYKAIREDYTLQPVPRSFTPGV